MIHPHVPSNLHPQAPRFRSTCSPHPTPHTPHPTPYTLHPTPYTLHPTPYTLYPTPDTREIHGVGLTTLRASSSLSRSVALSRSSVSICAFCASLPPVSPPPRASSADDGLSGPPIPFPCFACWGSKSQFFGLRGGRCLGVLVVGLELQVRGLAFGGLGYHFLTNALEVLEVKGFRFRVSGFGSRILGVTDIGFRDSGFRSLVSGFRF